MGQKNKPLKEHFISIIIPAYKAEKFIRTNLIQVRDIMEEMRYSYEIICVVDGKLDNTYEIANKVAKTYPQVKVEGYLTNLGKGHAVRYGMAKAKGDIIAFIDAGLEL